MAFHWYVVHFSSAVSENFLFWQNLFWFFGLFLGFVEYLGIWCYTGIVNNASLILGLSLEQVDILWHCLVEDSECYDDALHWFLNQVRSKDQHAMGMETYKHLFLEKVCRELIVLMFLYISALFKILLMVSVKYISSMLPRGSYLLCKWFIFFS